MMIGLQSLLHAVEVGKWRTVSSVIPLLAAFFAVAGVYDSMIYPGLNDSQSMDTAQLARRIARGQGYTTEFLRPYAIAQLTSFTAHQGGSGQLFPSDKFPAGVPRTLPDTYNAPGYPYLLAGFFKVLHVDSKPSAEHEAQFSFTKGEQFIPLLNQIFILLTALVIFGLSARIFDRRVSWTATIGFLSCDLVWQYSISALSTCWLMFLITSLMYCAVEIFCASEDSEYDDTRVFPVWLWGISLALLLTLACFTQFLLLILLVPLLLYFIFLPRPLYTLFPAITLVVLGSLAPWFWHMTQISGNPLGSNLSILLYGSDGFHENQIYRTLSIPSYERLAQGVLSKQFTGFRWHFEQAWSLLGSNPLILFFAVSTIYPFIRLRAYAFRWLIMGSALCLILMSNFGFPQPEPISPWNLIVILLPSMLVVGAAFFITMVERLDLPLLILKNGLIVILLILTALPLLLSLTVGRSRPLYPPYVPFIIKSVSGLTRPDEWVASDMPWATAWYADHASLWLPDSVKDFNDLNDNVCPSGILLLTPVTLREPFINATSGENKEWLPFITFGKIPSSFPLSSHITAPPGGAEYFLWSDSPRWQK